MKLERWISVAVVVCRDKICCGHYLNAGVDSYCFKQSIAFARVVVQLIHVMNPKSIQI